MAKKIKTKRVIKPEPVPVGYRLLGAFFALIGLAIFSLAFTILSAGWLIIIFTLAIGIGFLVPGLGLLFAKNKQKADESIALVLLNIILPY